MFKLFTKTWAVYLTLTILIGIYILNPILLQSARLNTFDFYQTFSKNYESKSIILLDISDKALNKQGQWPWKRDLLGRAVVNAYRNGAALVILQVVFPHKDRLGGDEIFLKMISKYPVILTETNNIKNLIDISRKALAVGNVSVPVDIDGTIRKLPLDKSIPEVILKVLNSETLAKDTIWIDFRHNIPRIDYTDKDWSSVKGKIVFIGTTFQGSTFVTTPDGLKNTHEIMAISTETLLSGNYISRPYWLPYGEFAFIILGALFFLIVIPRCSVIWSAIWYVGYLFDISLTSSYLWVNHLYLTDWFSPLIIGSVVWGQLTYNNYSKENKLRLQIKKQFEHYLSPDMVKKLQKDPSLLKLGGERKELTFMFSDIRGFTPISESMKNNPEKLTRYVNKFLTAMTTIILKNGGTIDKYMGDCIMAFWNAPLDCKNHKMLAVKTSIEMKTKLDQMNKTAEFDPPLKIGIGLNTGDCLVGNMGSEQRFDYSVIGDAVNLASRLEGLSKNYDTTTIVNKDTADGIDYIPLLRPKGFKFAKLDDVLVKGKTEKVTIYSIKN